MYRLKSLSNGQFQIHSSRHRDAFEGTFNPIVRMAVQMGISEGELIRAVNAMYDRGHDCAEFYGNGMLIGTKRTQGGGPHGFGWQ